jgi:flagellar FliL protein
MAGLAGVSLVIGLGVGGWVVGPMVAGGGGAPPAEAAAATAGQDAAGGTDAGDDYSGEASDGKTSSSGTSGGKGAGADAPVHRVDNLVVNPAETRGTRFLVVSVALEAASTVDKESLGRREVAIRDTLLTLLGSKAVDDLTDMSRRGELKEELRTAVEALAGRGSVRHVYLPQFVIQ